MTDTFEYETTKVLQDVRILLRGLMYRPAEQVDVERKVLIDRINDVIGCDVCNGEEGWMEDTIVGPQWQDCPNCILLPQRLKEEA